MATYDTGKMILFFRSLLWDLDIVPQEAATLLYKDSNICTAMGNTQKPTPRTLHIDIKYLSLCEWVGCNLILLDQIDTSINMSDHLTKSLQLLLFHRHADFLLGHVPPSYSPIYFTIVGTYTNHTIDLKNLSLSLSLPHLQPLLLESMHHLRQIMHTVRGYTFLGMMIQSSDPMILFVCLVYSIHTELGGGVTKGS
jgi:hypothetical protein